MLADEEGSNIARALGSTNQCAILQNHGLLTLGDTVDECAYLFSALEKQCQIQLLMEAAAANGVQKSIISERDASFTAAAIQHHEVRPGMAPRALTRQAIYWSMNPEIELIKEREPEVLL